MRLGFLGAASVVTDSCTLVVAGESRLLVDSSMFQGAPKARSKNPRTLSPGFAKAIQELLAGSNVRLPKPGEFITQSIGN